MHKKIAIFLATTITAFVLGACDSNGNLILVDEEGRLLGMDPVYNYCKDHTCLPAAEMLHRPTTLQISFTALDTITSVYLETLDCKLLENESADSVHPACVTKIKVGDSDSIRNMPPFDYYNRHYNYGMSIDPDGDNHLRFTLVDIKGEEKKFDIDLNSYIKMHHKVYAGDTCNQNDSNICEQGVGHDTTYFSFPEGLDTLEGYTLDTNFDRSQLPNDTEFETIEECSIASYEYDYDLDTAYKCVSCPDWMDDSTRREALKNNNCPFYMAESPEKCDGDTLYILPRRWEQKDIGCLHFTATDLPQDVAIADMFSTSRIKNNYEADKAYRSASIYDIWRATFRLGNQSSFKTDSLVIIVNDPYNYDE